MTWWLWLGLILCLLGLAGLGLSYCGQRRWAGSAQALLRKLEAGRMDGQRDAAAPPARYDVRELEGLSAPVQRYFRAALRDGQPIITAVNIDIAGRFNMSPTGEQRKPFTSRQRVTTRRPGFVWDARIAMLPGVAVCVIDGFVVGKGLLQASPQGLFTMAEVQGDG